MLPASGWTTARANAVATAASTALPPPSMTSIPTCEAIAFCDATMAFLARTGTEAAEPVAAGASANDSTSPRRRGFIADEGYHWRRGPSKPPAGGSRGCRRRYDGPIVSGVPKDEGPSLFVHSLPGSFSDLGPLGRELALDAGCRALEGRRPGRSRDPAGRGTARGLAPDARRRRDHDPAPVPGGRGRRDGGARRPGALGDRARPLRLARADDPGRAASASSCARARTCWSSCSGCRSSGCAA